MCKSNNYWSLQKTHLHEVAWIHVERRGKKLKAFSVFYKGPKWAETSSGRNVYGPKPPFPFESPSRVTIIL